MERNIELIKIKLIVWVFVFSVFPLINAFAVPAENVMLNLNEINKIKKMQEQIDLIRTYPQPVMRIQRLLPIAKLSSVAKLPAYPRVYSFAKIISRKQGVGIAGAKNNSPQLKSPEKVVVLPALPKATMSENKSWFERVLKSEDKKKR
jgi:hypothetical protein